MDNYKENNLMNTLTNLNKTYIMETTDKNMENEGVENYFKMIREVRGEENFGNHTLGLREKIYQGYDSLMKSREQQRIIFPKFSLEKNRVFWSDDIEDDEIRGKTYLFGRKVSKKKLGYGRKKYIGIVVDTQDGIELFEHYTDRKFRPIVTLPNNEGLIANLAQLEKNKTHEDLEGKTPKEIIKINFDIFPILMEKFNSSSKEDYYKFYVELSSENPLLY